MNEFRNKEGKKGLDNIEKLISLYGGKNGFSAGEVLLWSDLYIYDITSQAFGKDSIILKDYPRVEKVRTKVEANPNVARYLKNRKESPIA